MGKKNTNAAAKAAKKAKAQAKTERKEKKKVLGGGKAGGVKGKGKVEEDDEDLEAILDKVGSIHTAAVRMMLTLFVPLLLHIFLPGFIHGAQSFNPNSLVDAT